MCDDFLHFLVFFFPSTAMNSGWGVMCYDLFYTVFYDFGLVLNHEKGTAIPWVGS